MFRLNTPHDPDPNPTNAHLPVVSIASTLYLLSARIAQRFALVKIHKLWNSGRAEPRSGVITGTDAEGGEAEATNQPATGATATESLVQHTGAGLYLPTCRREEAWEGGSGEVARDDSAQWRAPEASLESTVAGVAGLPQEVLRRIVSYCTI